jgi:hypothetical protein
MSKILTVALLAIAFFVFDAACRAFPEYQPLLFIIALATIAGCKCNGSPEHADEVRQ